MSAPLVARSWRLGPAELRGVARRCQGETLVQSLRVRAAAAAGFGRLREVGLCDDYGVDPGLETAIRVLAAPECAFAIRLFSPDESYRPVRALVATTGVEGAVALVESSGDVQVGAFFGSNLAAVAAEVWRVLGDAAADDVIPFQVVLETLGARLTSCTDVAEVRAVLAALGCDPDQARALAAALSAPRRAEIVARTQVDGLTQTSIGAVAVFDGAAGRVMAVPDTASDGVAWTTLSGGSRQRLERALAQLVETIPGSAKT